ncbi:MAG: potassium transporter TrkG [Bauldia sp.]
MIGVLHILSQVLGALALALLVPAAIAFVGGEGTTEGYLVVAGLAGFLAGAIFFAYRDRGRGVGRVDRFVLVVVVWTVAPMIAAVPIMLSAEVPYTFALFEAASGLTTTGATVFASLADLGPAVIFWRAELQWLGGFATLCMFALVLAPAELGGLSSRGLSLVGGVAGHGPSRAGRVIREVGVIYAMVTGGCIILLFAGGVPTYDAICLAFATVSTGGFMPRDGTLAAYGSRFAELVVAVFMLVGATSIVWQRMVLEGRRALLLEHRESYWVIGAALAAGFLYAVGFAGSERVLAALGEGLFTGISLVSTTGFETRPAGLAGLPESLVMLLALAGAASLSTAGGLKLYRVGAMLVQSSHELKRLIFPHLVRPTRVGGQPYDLGLMKAIWANLGLSLVVIMAAALLLSLSLPSFDAAVVATVAGFSGIGPLYSPEWPTAAAWPSYAAFDGLSKVVMVVTMVLGRIEVIVFFAAANPAYWRS